MDWSRCSLFLIIMLLLAGCRQQDSAVSQTPTPFTSAGMTPRAPVGEPIALSLTHLAANPGLYEGANLLLHGEYRPLPKLVCMSNPFPSPATWGIIGEDLQANASGYDQQLRQLLEEGQEITVEGRWLHYSGPVGCGKSAPEQDVWYLSVSRIIEPHPLARGVPGSAGTSTEVPAIAGLPASPTLSAELQSPELVETAAAEPDAVLASPTQPGDAESIQPNETQIPTLTPAVTAPATVTEVTPDLTVAANTTPASTNTPGSKGTPIASTATPGATATTGPTDVKGSIDYEDLVMGTLQNGAVDAWTVNVGSSEFLTITAAPAASANIIISVLDPNGQILVNGYDQANAGEIETITKLALPETGTYRILIAANPAAKSDYALMVMDSDSYSFFFRGTLDPGIQRSDSFSVENDHFWFFPAVDGETIRFEVTPNGSADPYVELYGVDGSRLLTLDDGGGTEVEILENYSILASGLYAIRVGEFDYEEMSYQILMEKE